MKTKFSEKQETFRPTEVSNFSSIMRIVDFDVALVPVPTVDDVFSTNPSRDSLEVFGLQMKYDRFVT